ncbi:MAG: hypothetical protein LBJ62_04505 [Bifidobacteriaceae bacterium]|jgi:hypothetical protein|nr:hypothetical protein [Bifidobacteriaceae bacterium]
MTVIGQRCPKWVTLTGFRNGKRTDSFRVKQRQFADRRVYPEVGLKVLAKSGAV